MIFRNIWNGNGRKMRKLLKNLIGDRAFYRMVMAITLPIMLQNFITNLVSMLDNLMVGALGTEPMSGVSIVNQLIFIFNLAIFGAFGGVGIFTAQFHGKGDAEGIRHTLRYKLILAIGLFAAALAVFLSAGDTLIGLFLHDADATGDIAATLGFAKEYLAVMLFGLLPFALSQIMTSTLRETGETVLPMVTSTVAVVTNCVFNYLLIFGKLGFPVLGVVGAAAATVLSRYVELAVVLVVVFLRRAKYPFFSGIFRGFRIPGELVWQITVKGMPLLVNELFWSVGMSLLSMGYSLHGLSVVAGYSMSSTITNLFGIAFMSLGVSIGIIVGRELGAGRFAQAVDWDRKLIAFAVAVSVVIGGAVFAGAELIPSLYNTNELSKTYAAYFIRVSACLMPVQSFANAAYFTLRSGGKTVITFFFDGAFAACIQVPAVFLLYLCGLSVWWVFPMVQGLDILKDVLGFVLLKKKTWVQNIVA